MKKLIFSPPFSNIFNFKSMTRIVGTYTAKPRRGLWRVLTTLRKTKGGWYNRVGLRNPGIARIRHPNEIVSISLLEDEDWPYMHDKMLVQGVKKIELNISCPNAHVSLLNKKIISQATENYDVILKIPHGSALEDVERYSDLGIEYFHISNTKPTSRGALSGIALISTNLRLIDEIKSKNEKIKIIGGGGIYDLETLRLYERAGADHFSLSTAILSPIKFYKIIKNT
jgi:dihydroorotate dehydrogenase